MTIEGGNCLRTKAWQACHSCGKGYRAVGHWQLGLQAAKKGCRKVWVCSSCDKGWRAVGYGQLGLEAAKEGCRKVRGSKARLGVGAWIAGQKRMGECAQAGALLGGLTP